MKLPLSLIKSFISTDLSVEKIADTLTLLGIEVDAIHAPYAPFRNVVVAEVKAAQRHPAADKLQVAQVFDGTHTYQIVCGAPNCRAKLRVALAKVGATLTDEAGKTRTLAPTSIRGIESLGMLCSASELGLYKDNDGILELPSEFPLGSDCSSLLWDPVFELSLTPNLGHCMSALGVARELSAFLQKKLLLPTNPLKEEGDANWTKEWKLEVKDPALCPSYFGCYIEGVTIGPSPFWLRKTLAAAGMRSICNAVDIGNYILLKTGQPLHLFDADAIEGKLLQVALSDQHIPFLGLDGISREIPPKTLLISDAKGPVAIAGILGGTRGSTGSLTKNILIEAAAFDPQIIRKAIKSLDLRTESSQRFEKGIDPEGTLKALNETASLLVQICGGKIAPGKIEKQRPPFTPKKIFLRPPQVTRILGTALSQSEIQELLQRLMFSCQEKEGGLEVEVPLFRSDISEEIDLIEEVARLFGFNHLTCSNAQFSLSPHPHDSTYLFEQEVRKKLIGFGLQEFLTSDLISPQLIALAKEWLHPHLELLTALNPKTEIYSILRPSLLPGLMEVAARNFNQKNSDFAAFEIGNIHLLEEKRLLERPMIALLLSGKRAPHHWSAKENDWDFFDLKGLIEQLFGAFLLPPCKIEHAHHPSFHPHSQANLLFGDERIGSLGALHPLLLAQMEIKAPLFYAEIDLQHLMRLATKQSHMQPLPKFPESERDWTLPYPSRMAIQDLFTVIYKQKVPLLEKVELIDLYHPSPQEKQMVTLRFTYRDHSKTLSFEEVQQTHEALVAYVTNSLQIEARSE
ncbi:MAG TPA: phenylalanine--tRNA ligase subunit beta [Chlamydiales bacterium]|nr:phenylalanine--tRNA ligase subunit beta [Chlamydiales bacterium]